MHDRCVNILKRLWLSSSRDIHSGLKALLKLQIMTALSANWGWSAKGSVVPSGLMEEVENMLRRYLTPIEHVISESRALSHTAPRHVIKVNPLRGGFGLNFIPYFRNTL